MGTKDYYCIMDLSLPIKALNRDLFLLGQRSCGLVNERQMQRIRHERWRILCAYLFFDFAPVLTNVQSLQAAMSERITAYSQ